MIADPALKWGVGGAFTVTALYWAVRSVDRRVTVPGRITAILHVVMALAMLTMVWPEFPGIPTIAGMAVFTGATAIVLVLWVVWHPYRVESAYHTLMMATMVWMYAVMDSAVVGGTGATATGAPPHTDHSSMHHGEAAADVTDGSAAGSAAATMRLPTWAGYLNLTVGLVYLTVAAAWIVHTFRRRAAGDPAPFRAGSMHAVMAVATAAMFLSYTG